MSAIHWIAIAAIITPFITSWLQFWLKQRSDRKALPTANPATIQPQPNIQREPNTRFGAFLMGRWRLIVIQWIFNFIAVFILVRYYYNQSPVTPGSVILIALTTTLWLFFTLVVASDPD